MAMEGNALTLVTLGLLLLAGMAARWLGSRTHVPGVTLLLLVGVAAGPAGLDLLPEQRETWFPLMARVALVLVGFLLGHEFTRGALKERGREVLILSALVTLATTVIVTAGLVLLSVPLSMALLLGVIATATAPAATVAVVQEVDADGPFTRTLLGIVAVDDVWGLMLFSLVMPFAAWLAGNGEGMTFAMEGLQELGGGLALGVVLGIPMAFLTGRLRSGEPTRLEALGFVLLCGGLATWLGVSYLLAAVVMGAVVANLARHHERPFRAIEGIETPFLVIFFLLAGASLELGALHDAGLFVAAYVVLRIVGRLLGADLGARLAGVGTGMRRWMGLALLPQAGVALGLALAVSDRFPELGRDILPLVIVATVIFEIFGPVLTRQALRRVGEARA